MKKERNDPSKAEDREQLHQYLMNPEYHDFYNLKKDGDKVHCLFDSHMAQEKINIYNLTPKEMNIYFRVREIIKYIPESRLSIKIPICRVSP